MKGLSVERIRKLEKQAKDLGLEERILIENASSNLFGVIDSLHLGQQITQQAEGLPGYPLGRQKVLVVSGRGNNGADVLSCARKLFSRGYGVRVAVLEDKELGKEAYFQKNLLEKIKVPIYSIRDNNIQEFKKFLQNGDFILEGILGIGVKGEISPFLKKVITLINESAKRIVSCDIPSGLHPDEGVILGEAIKASYTITFIAQKRGFFLKQGPSCCGKIFVVDIGVSRQILEKGIRDKG